MTGFFFFFIEYFDFFFFFTGHLHRPIPHCRCNCSAEITDDERETVLLKFKNFKNHSEQNVYLQGCCVLVDTKRKRPRREAFQQQDLENEAKRHTYKYVVAEHGGRQIYLCQRAFLTVLDIKQSRLSKKVKNHAEDIHDNRGKHGSRPNKTPEESLNLVRDFLKNVPAIESHYLGTKQKTKVYIDPQLSIVELWRQYNDQHPDNKVSEFIFSRIFHYEFNISFGYPRSDKCETCDELQ